jgi:hypothetical protein
MTRFSTNALVLIASILFGLVVFISTQFGVARNISSLATTLSFASLALIIYFSHQKSIGTFASLILIILALVDFWWPALRAWSMTDVNQYIIEMGYNEPSSKFLSYQFLVGLNVATVLMLWWPKKR